MATARYEIQNAERKDGKITALVRVRDFRKGEWSDWVDCTWDDDTATATHYGSLPTCGGRIQAATDDAELKSELQRLDDTAPGEPIYSAVETALAEQVEA